MKRPERMDDDSLVRYVRCLRNMRSGLQSQLDKARGFPVSPLPSELDPLYMTRSEMLECVSELKRVIAGLQAELTAALVAMAERHSNLQPAR